MRATIPAAVAVAVLLVAACSSNASTAPTSPPTIPLTTPSTAPAPAPSATPPTSSSPSVRTSATRPVAPRSTERVGPPAPGPPTAGTSSHTAVLSSLPLHYSTGDARQVITVVAGSHSSTTAVLQTWRRAGGAWTKVGPEVAAWLGSGGIGPTNEQSTATPQGSFTFTEAFGREPDPGTSLPYRQTTPADWWISEAGPLYNTEQHCSSDCPFTQGDPNEHLYYSTPFYEYAVVIDYNTNPVVPGAGSAFFLHVTVGQPTQGCVSIAEDQLVRILRWLRPADHPRIVMGVG